MKSIEQRQNLANNNSRIISPAGNGNKQLGWLIDPETLAWRYARGYSLLYGFLYFELHVSVNVEELEVEFKFGMNTSNNVKQDFDTM